MAGNDTIFYRNICIVNCKGVRIFFVINLLEVYMDTMAIKYSKRISLLTFILFSLSISGCNNEPPLATASQVDITQYMGKWYEIAALPNKYQADCNCRMTNYAYSGSNVTINHTCLLTLPTSTSWVSVPGTGTIEPYSGNAKWKIQVGQKFETDYYIIFVSNDYQFAITGDPSRKYLWILARSPVITQAQYNALTSIAAAQQFNVNNLQIVDQSCYSQQPQTPETSSPQPQIPETSSQQPPPETSSPPTPAINTTST